MLCESKLEIYGSLRRVASWRLFCCREDRNVGLESTAALLQVEQVIWETVGILTRFSPKWTRNNVGAHTRISACRRKARAVSEQGELLYDPAERAVNIDSPVCFQVSNPSVSPRNKRQLNALLLDITEAP